MDFLQLGTPPSPTVPLNVSADAATTLNMMNARREGLGRMLGRELLNVLFEY